MGSGSVDLVREHDNTIAQLLGGMREHSSELPSSENA
jgi:hypothetical protein